MPDYLVEVHVKTTYGPFTYPNPGDLKADLTAGKLKLDDLIREENAMTRLSVKELK